MSLELYPKSTEPFCLTVIRSPKYHRGKTMGQAKHPIRNGAEYNRDLINRTLLFGMDKTAIANGYCPLLHGKRARGL